MRLILKVGDKIEQRDLISHLVRIQYERNDMEFTRGKFRVRGDTIDVFPAEHSEMALRIELFDDEIEAMYFFDPLTGKTRQKVDRFAIYPTSNYVTPRNDILRAIEAIKDELRDQETKFIESGKLLEAQRIRERTLFDLEMLHEVGFCKGIENYSRHLAGGLPGEPPPTLIDYLPKDALMFFDESHVLLGQIGGMYRGDSARKETLVTYGFRLPSAKDNRPLRFDEFESKMRRAIFVSATPADYELNHSSQIVEQVVRPTGLVDPEVEVRPATTQVDDVLGEIKERISKGQRILITTLTKRMAEDLTDFLQDNDIKVRYLHSDIDTVERVEIIRDLRAGVFDVLIGINLLREGLDIPKVALVAILDADKEGFLRSERSLIQTIGRAARNVEAKPFCMPIRLPIPCAERWTKRLDAEKNKRLTTSHTTSRLRALRKGSVTLLTVSTRAITSKMNSDWWTVRITKKWVRRNWHAKSNGSKTKCLSMLRISNSKKPRKSVINWLQFVNKFSARRPEKMRKVQKRTYRCSF